MNKQQIKWRLDDLRFPERQFQLPLSLIECWGRIIPRIHSVRPGPFPEVTQLQNRLYDLCKQIGKFYYFKKFNKDEAKASEHVYLLQIQDMKLDGDTLTIITTRPGILIGRLGKDIGQLTEYLGVKIRIEESPTSFPDLIQYGIHEETDQYKFDAALDVVETWCYEDDHDVFDDYTGPNKDDYDPEDWLGPGPDYIPGAV